LGYRGCGQLLAFGGIDRCPPLFKGSGLILGQAAGRALAQRSLNFQETLQASRLGPPTGFFPLIDGAEAHSQLPGKLLLGKPQELAPTFDYGGDVGLHLFIRII
jgi:hypothetical protein